MPPSPMNMCAAYFATGFPPPTPGKLTEESLLAMQELKPQCLPFIYNLEAQGWGAGGFFSRGGGN